VNATKLDWSAENTANARNVRMECKERVIFATKRKNLSLLSKRNVEWWNLFENKSQQIPLLKPNYLLTLDQLFLIEIT
jgi:hypothetical protein